MPTKQRVHSKNVNVPMTAYNPPRCAKCFAVPASPEAPLARLHRMTPMPTRRQRGMRSASQPNSGAMSI